MLKWFNQRLDSLSEYFANRKGLLPIFGIFLVVLNYFLQFLPIGGWLIDSNLFLHLGIVVALGGILLSWAL